MTPFLNRHRGLLFCLLVLLAAGCDTQNAQDDFERAASRTPSGITETDADGQILDADRDDWRTAPLYEGVVRVEPAYPNPTVPSSLVTIRVSFDSFDGVRGDLTLETFDANGRPLVLDRIENRGPGFDSFIFTAGLLGQGLTRVFVFDTVGGLVSYGDIRVQ